MADGKQVMESDGTFFLSSLGLWDICETCCGGGGCTFDEVSLFPSEPTPPNFFSDASYELGVRFYVDAAAEVKTIKFYKHANDTATHTGRLWDNGGTQVASVVFTGESSSGWQSMDLATPYELDVGDTYTASVNTNAWYGRQGASPIDHGCLQAASRFGRYNVTPGSYPSTNFDFNHYFRDIVLTAL